MQPFLHRVKKPIVAVLLPFLFLACASSRVVRLTVPVEEAVTVGRLTQPRDRPASERVLLAAPGKPVRVGEITRVRLVAPSGKPLRTIPLPFWAEQQQGHLVLEDRAGHLRAIPLTSVDRLEVESLFPRGYWRPADYLILAGFTLLGVLFGGAWVFMLDRHDD
jgi:hypothetical protein